MPKTKDIIKAVGMENARYGETMKYTCCLCPKGLKRTGSGIMKHLKKKHGIDREDSEKLVEQAFKLHERR